MLKGNNDAILLQRHINSDYILFYQVWQELVYSKTITSHQYHIMTSLSILKELEDTTVKTLEGLFISDANIQCCKDEALYLLNNDSILFNYKKPILNRLQSSLANSIKSPEEKKKLLYQIRYAIREIEPDYYTLVLENLKKSIQTQDEKGIVEYSDMAISLAINHGWSTHGLDKLLRFFQLQNTTPATQWRKFSLTLKNSSKPYFSVLIKVPFKPQLPDDQRKTLRTLNELSLQTLTCNQILKRYPSISQLSSAVQSNARYFLVTIRATDGYSAAHIAISKVSEKLNIASFYNLVKAWDLTSVKLISINMATHYCETITAEQLYHTYDYIDSSGQIFQSTKKVFSDEGKKALQDRLSGSFGYTNMSRSSLFQEEKYMNLWVALESLARSDMYSDIISCIKETVPPAVSLRYLYQLVRNYTEDCIRCGLDFTFSTYSIDVNQETKQKMVREVISVFRDSSLYQELLQKSKVNSLLHYRTQTIHNLLTDRKKAIEKVVNHKKHISWQIQRLYRIRNEIAHSALHDNAMLLVYIRHLYDYLALFISEVITRTVDKQYDSLNETLSSIRDEYDVFVALSKDSEAITLESSFLETGIINLLS